MIFQNLVNEFSKNPGKLFLIDGAGALLSAFLLGVVLVRLEHFFGIPKRTLYFLASLPCLFSIYDFYCYRSELKNVGFYLKIIALINLSYCITSIGVALYHFQKITYLGWIYIIIEILIVLFLVKLEWNTATKISSRKIQ